ncbi:MAG: argininosuccinate lyase [Candidatus Altiarchaeum hamiconexum]|mgnify:CR=1 FL=1|uniref:Argininosuccinate lyase n=1 Tax=Candidatus Altarchaeum hamiconexum TaxID=1803513 RepID=A0A8J7YVK9_9ARCH|nr:argininosuccinate lyase [Candidatus Altarchaeum hamiconexum]OIQ04955.1 MAG: argininosuccinate lyase [Candidatus Altarchaeum sp. CG2_30_32_3053]PIN66925.1 MAG: argininosuccinate lyase [Candidatus Altarchaeum sp. CG12_big_fil_rev_8_21_14_0_65_33_22]PIV28258.1 MAG: argininosuccinate lyase [Candidatus Altarchaeum sp. CG03_land_8_20_14_0_80_32_618]PIX49459.1 MAG: argininosuccinate lyase [Candidatus Altarchaeum sp. CG_4_8_14_3_um_filter_33_2054]PIZ32407.1 MAG: argininosuccinate lyase [Candidatus 
MSIKKFTQSLDIDMRLFEADIWNTTAHNLMLAKRGIIEKSTAKDIIKNLNDALSAFNNKKFKFSRELEDVHMNIEDYVISKGGEKCGAMHTARSRNDQVVTDTRILAREITLEIMKNLLNLSDSLIDFAERSTVIIPGYTHLQQAMPTLASHWILAYTDAFLRDFERLNDSYKRTNLCPLGSAAFAGTSFNINRHWTAKLLGFDGLIENSLDGVAGRDFIAEILADLAILSATLSRLSEELILFNSYEFGLIEISSEWTTGSSIMPQKKNLDIAELTRGKTGRIYGDLVNILVLLKGIPYSYNRDMQEDKFPLFDAGDELNSILKILAEMSKGIKFKDQEQINKKFSHEIIATDMASQLVIKGIPFRKSYNIVKNAINKGDFSEINKIAGNEISKINVENCVQSRKITGSAGYVEVERMIADRKKKIEKFYEIVEEKRKRTEGAKIMTKKEIRNLCG